MKGARRILGWFEVVLGGASLAVGLLLAVLGFLRGHRDPHHGGMYAILGGAMAAGFGIAFLVAGLLLRGRNPYGWLCQALPATIVAWVLWELLIH